MTYRINFERIGVENSFADITQRVVHRMGQRVNKRRLVIAGEHDARAFVLLEIERHCFQPCGSRSGWNGGIPWREWSFFSEHWRRARLHARRKRNHLSNSGKLAWLHFP